MSEYCNPHLQPLLELADGRRVEDAEDWSRRKAEIRDLLCRYFVGFPPDEAPALVSHEVIEETTAEDRSRRQTVSLRFDTSNDATFSVEILVPPSDGPFPVFMTVPYAFWPDLALSRGYLVCVYPGGDKHDACDLFAEEYPESSWSRLLRRAWLSSRALDYLSIRPDVDTERIAMSGHSRNGKQTMIAAAFDERITAIVSSSSGSPGAAPYRFCSRHTFAEAPSDWPNNWFVDSLKTYTGREDELPIDAHGWYALIAPRPCLISTAHNDGCEPTLAVERAYLEGREAYRFLGSPEALRIRWRPGQHHGTEEQDRRMVEGYFDWFDSWFDHGTANRQTFSKLFPEEFIHLFDWQAWRDGRYGARRREADVQTPPLASAPPAEAPPRDTPSADPTGADAPHFYATQADPPPVDTPPLDAPPTDRIGWGLGTPPDEIPWDGVYTFLRPDESAMMTHDRWEQPDTKRIPVSFGENVHGNIYCNPKVTEPAPAVIWLHPYSYHSGYNEGYGPGEPGEGTTVYHRLAQAGYVVLAFDQCGFGLRLLEGRDFYDAYPAWSRLGRMVHDARAAVDFLHNGRGRSQGPLPPVDVERIVTLGFSIGGMTALYAGALDPRIAAVASFCGFTPLRTDTDDKPTGGIRRLWELHALQPLLGLFHGRESDLPYDFDDIVAEIAPRRCLIYAPTRDRHADHQEVTACVERARSAWEQAGNGDALTLETPDDVGRFQSAQQQVFLEWMERL